jgi:hypothetical protein
VRGAIDGIPSPSDPRPFRGFWLELLNVIPPLTLLGAARRGALALGYNLGAAAGIALAVWGMIQVTGAATWQQWTFVGIGAYAVCSWATALRERDLPTFQLIWGTPAFLCTTLGYGMVAFIGYASGYWGAPYAERTFEISKSDLGWWVGAPAALAGFLGVILGGRLADWLQARHEAGRVMVVMLGLVSTVPPLYWAYTADDFATFAVLSFVGVMCYSSALGGAAAASQALVLPRMRGTATATFFIATTLVGLALGPFMAGYVSSINGDDLSIGVISTLAAAPVGVILLLAAIRLFPGAAATLEERARAAGEAI